MTRTALLRALALAACLGLAACQSEKIDNSVIVGPTEPVSFSQDIHPLLSASCSGVGCHVGEGTNGVDLTTHASIIGSVGLQYGEAIVRPGDAARSPIVDKLSAQPRFGARMPLGRAPLSTDQIAVIREWIDDGAPEN